LFPGSDEVIPAVSFALFDEFRPQFLDDVDIACIEQLNATG
jgi:hypothetical protein